jgi:hypothetical protein
MAQQDVCRTERSTLRGRALGTLLLGHGYAAQPHHRHSRRTHAVRLVCHVRYAAADWACYSTRHYVSCARKVISSRAAACSTEQTVHLARIAEAELGHASTPLHSPYTCMQFAHVSSFRAPRCLHRLIALRKRACAPQSKLSATQGHHKAAPHSGGGSATAIARSHYIRFPIHMSLSMQDPLAHLGSLCV